MNKLFGFLKKDDIGEPPWSYDFLINLDKSEYPKYLKKIYKLRTDEDLPLKWDFKSKALVIDKNRCKTFNEKIQYLKLYDNFLQKKLCTDKVQVRDYVQQKIGDEYLKPVLQICKNFDEIDFEKLPDEFVIKCSHGCKWHFIIRNKEDLLKNEGLIVRIKKQITGWMEQEFWPWEGFEMQYQFQGILEPKLLIEPFMAEENNESCTEIEVFCFNGEPRLFLKVKYLQQREISYYDENFNQIDLILHPDGYNKIIKEKADEFVRQTKDISKKLSEGFKLVRVDWMIYKGKLYFEEMTFTPYSGFVPFDKNWEKKLGSWIEL